MFLQLGGGIERALGHAMHGREAFEAARGTVARDDDGARPQQAVERGRQRFYQAIGPGCVRLHHDYIAEAVDDAAGNAVGLGMHQAIERRADQPLA